MLSWLRKSKTKELNIEKENILIEKELKTNYSILKELFNNCSDVIFRELKIGDSNLTGLIIYIDGLINTELLHEHLLEPIQKIKTNNQLTIEDIEQAIYIADRKKTNSFGKILEGITAGEIAFFINQLSHAYLLSIKEWEKRSITEPMNESNIRGPSEGFIESIRVNTSLLRRKIKTPKLKMESYKIGKKSKTDVVISYLDGDVNHNILEEVRTRLNKIDIDAILDSNYLIELMNDNIFSLFPLIQYTERPDKVAASILEGRIAILVDGSPQILIVPTVMLHFLHASDDYYEHFFMASLIRILRITAIFLALFTPSLYIALTTFHQEMIPPKLLVKIIGSRELVPLPAFFEALLMELTFELLRESGIRLPKIIGSAVSIVGAMVIGEAAVQAGLVSQIMVIVVSITAIASFAIPAYNFAITIRVIRFVSMLLASILGLYGVLILFLILIIYTSSLRSFGVPYLSPYAPLKISDWKDFVLRAPWIDMKTRPETTSAKDKKRAK